MTPPRLTTVPTDFRRDLAADAAIYDLGRGAETPTERLRRLRQEMRMLAREQVEALARDVEAISQRATDIAEGGDAYPAGVREMASRIAADLPEKAKGLLMIMERAGRV
jgi:hypothetical protein